MNRSVLPSRAGDGKKGTNLYDVIGRWHDLDIQGKLGGYWSIFDVCICSALTSDNLVLHLGSPMEVVVSLSFGTYTRTSPWLKAWTRFFCGFSVWGMQFYSAKFVHGQARGIFRGSFVSTVRDHRGSGYGPQDCVWMNDRDKQSEYMRQRASSEFSCLQIEILAKFPPLPLFWRRNFVWGRGCRCQKWGIRQVLFLIYYMADGCCNVHKINIPLFAVP